LDHVSQRRGKNVAVIGAVLQLLFTLVMTGLWLLNGSIAAKAGAWFLAGGLGVWLMVALLFYTRQLERREALELEELSAKQSGTIFDAEAAREVRSAQRRLAWMERWAVPAFTLLWAAYYAAMGGYLVRRLGLAPLGPDHIRSAALGTFFAAFMTFLSFLFSRYALGMASRAEWRLLRAAGSHLFACTLAFAAVAAAMLLAHLRVPRADLYIAYAVAVAMILLAAELLLNFVLDVYRPRVPGQEHRPSFDSRLASFIAEPERIGHSIAEAMNYQFGFEVSSTWFYKLLSRAMAPLIVLGALILLAMTSVLVVSEGEEIVVRHLGRIDPSRGTLKPGIHLVWPWPIDAVDRFPTGQIHQILLGAGPARLEEERQQDIVPAGTFKGRELALWSSEHGQYKERDFLVAIPPDRFRSGELGANRPPVSIIRLVVAVQYVIEDVYKYGYNYRYEYKHRQQVADARALLEDEAYREMVQYLASATLDSPVGSGEADRPEAIMTYGQGRACDELRRRIQAVADQLDLGVRIVHVGILAIHPPPGAAPAFEDVLKAQIQIDQARYKAESNANRLLSQVAGDPDSALRLAMAIGTLEDLAKLSDLRGKPEDFQVSLRDYLRQAREDLKVLQEEIRRERLLGQQALLREQLAAQQAQRLALLEQIAQAGPAYSFDQQLQQLRRKVDELFALAAGSPASLEADAVANRWSRELTERARAESFQREVLAYEASPNIYMLDRWLEVYDQTLPGIDKYVVGVDRRLLEVWLNIEREPGVGGEIAPGAGARAQ